MSMFMSCYVPQHAPVHFMHLTMTWLFLVSFPWQTTPSVREKGLMTLGKMLGPVGDPWRNLCVPIRLQL